MVPDPVPVKPILAPTGSRQGLTSWTRGTCTSTRWVLVVVQVQVTTDERESESGWVPDEDPCWQGGKEAQEKHTSSPNLHALATSHDREPAPKLHLISLHPSLIRFVLPTHMMLPPRQKYTPIITHILNLTRAQTRGRTTRCPRKIAARCQDVRQKKLPSRGVTKRPKGKHEIATYNPRCAPECSRAKFSQSALYGGVVKTKRSSEILWWTLVMDVGGGYCGEPLSVEVAFSSSGSTSESG